MLVLGQRLNHLSFCSQEKQKNRLLLGYLYREYFCVSIFDTDCRERLSVEIVVHSFSLFTLLH